jgi:4-aminobutyrate aminotransferase-like enzyme
VKSTAKHEEQSWYDRDRSTIIRGSARIPFALATASGAIITDVDGNNFIDLTSGWNVANIGWNNSAVRESVYAQLAELPFAPSWCSHWGKIRYAESLLENFDAKENFACWAGCGGSEAIEAALKIARKSTGRKVVIGFSEAYHGGTLGAMLAGGIEHFHDIGGMECSHRHIRFPYPADDNETDWIGFATKTIRAAPLPAAVLLEAVFTNPGVIVPSANFLNAIQSTAREVGALVIVDEIGTGFGRCGSMFAYTRMGLNPDIIVLGKAMTAGVVPMSAAVVRKDILAEVKGSGLDSTYGWTPLACAAAQANLSVIRCENLCERASDVGESLVARFKRDLAKTKLVSSVRGLGLEIGIEMQWKGGQIAPQQRMRELLDRLRKRGVFAESSRFTSTLMIMPPLNIDLAILENAVQIVIEEIAQIDDELP